MKQLIKGFNWGLTGEVQDMLVEYGRVVARGPELGIPSETTRIDLTGKWLLPSFVESHCHILPTGLDLLKLHLGFAENHQDVLDSVRERFNEQPEGWIHAVHYDQNRYAGIHITRDQVDAISRSRPIVLRHVNGHASIANSAALEAAGIGEDVQDPVGGTYVRDEAGRLNGVLLEAAHEFVAAAAPKPSRSEMVEAILRAGKLMHSQGIGCATDMMTGFFNLEDELASYQLAAEAGSPIHMRLFVQWNEVFGPRAAPEMVERIRSLTHGSPSRPDRGKDVRVAGIKIFADGAIGSGTAAIYGKFLGERKAGVTRSRRGEDLARGPERETDGQLMYSIDRLNKMVETAHNAGFVVAVHSIGDYSTDLVMNAFERTGEPSRHRIEHAMLLSDAQIERMARLQLHCTFQPEFLKRLGPAYRRQLGEDRTAFLIRSRSVLDAGIPMSFSSDRPIVAGNPWDGIEAASNRPKGFSPTENCTREEAILAYTAGGALANGEPDLMGTLNPGSLADFQLYAKSPVHDAIELAVLNQDHEV